MADTIPHPKMDWSHPDRPQAYKEFKQTSNMWFQVKNIVPDKQHNYIILWAGREGLRIFNTWGLTDEQLQDPTNIWDKFSKHVQPHENFRIHRLEFQRYKRIDSESVDDFYTRCKAKAMKCQFKENSALEERIIEVLISGIKYTQTQKKLLGKDDKLSLQDALDICRTHEASVNHMAQLGNIGHDAKVDMVKLRDQCKNCGGSHPYKPRDGCPAYGTTCRKCGKTGHWQQVCLSSAGKGQSQQQPRKPRPRSDSRPRGSYRRSNTPKPNKRQSEVHYVQQQDMDDASNDFENMSFETVTITQHIDGINNTNNKRVDNRDQVFTTLNIKLKQRPGNHTLTAKVDTSAQGNIIPPPIISPHVPHIVGRRRISKTWRYNPSKGNSHSLQWHTNTAAWQYNSSMQIQQW